MVHETTKLDEPMPACCADMMEEMKTGTGQTEPCPMSTMCKGAMKKASFGFFLAMAGIALIVAGALILLEPAVLVWLMAGTSILLGVGMIAVATFLRRLRLS